MPYYSDESDPLPWSHQGRQSIFHCFLEHRFFPPNILTSLKLGHISQLLLAKWQSQGSCNCLFMCTKTHRVGSSGLEEIPKDYRGAILKCYITNCLDGPMDDIACENMDTVDSESESHSEKPDSKCE